MPPSLLALTLLLQAHDRVSDAEAKARADYDLRWKVALGIEVDTRPFAKSTLQLFRAQLILHDQAQAIFERSLDYAHETGYLKGRKIKVALDTTFILGRGAVKDTYPGLPVQGRQPAGGRDQEADLDAGQASGTDQAGGLGRSAWHGPLLRLERQGSGGDRLG